MAQRGLDIVCLRMWHLAAILLLIGSVGQALGQTGAGRSTPEALAPLWFPL